MIYKWTSLAKFETWHETAKSHLGIPYPPVNQATGQTDESAQWVVAYTTPMIISPTDVRAFVDDDLAAELFDGLGELSDYYIDPNVEVPF